MTAGVLIIGSDPGTGGTAALIVGDGSQTSATKFIVDTGVTVKLRGDLTLNGGTSNPAFEASFTAAAGSTIIIDPPSAGSYVINLSHYCKIICSGTTNTGIWPDTTGGNHVKWSTNLGRGGTAAYCVFSGGIPNTSNVFGGFTTCTFTEFSAMGTTSQYGIGIFCNTGSFSHDSDAMTMQNCTFTSCSYLILAEQGGTPWTGNYIWDSNIFTSGIATNIFGFPAAVWRTLIDAPGGGVTKELVNSSFDSSSLVVFDHCVNNTIAGNVFAGSVVNSGNPWTWTSPSMFTGNLLLTTGVTQTTSGPLDNCYITAASAIGNWIRLATGQSVTNCVFEQSAGSSGTSNLVLCQGSATVKNCIMLPAPGDGGGPGTIANVTPNTGGVTVEHCLLWGNGGQSWGVGIGSLGTAVAGDVVSCQANLAYHPSTAGTGNWLIVSITSFLLDAVTKAGHNATFNGSTSSNKYNAGASSATISGYFQLEVTDSHSFASNLNLQLAQGDFIADPVFVDHTRNLAAWSTHVGGAGTYNDAIARLEANPSLIASAMTWIKAGFVPTNAAYHNATYPGDAATTDANGNPLNGTVGPMGFSIPGAAALLCM